MSVLVPTYPVYYKYHTCYPITDPNSRPTTLIRCGPELYSIITRYWTKHQLYKFDNLMYNHGFQTMIEQETETIFNHINDKDLYNQKLDEFKIVDAEYTKNKDNEQYDKNVLAALKTQRDNLCKFLTSVRKRITRRDINVFSKK